MRSWRTCQCCRGPGIVLTLAIVGLLCCSVTSLSAATIAHWTLDDPSGTSGTGSVVDSRSGRNGITIGGVTFGGAGANANTGTAASFPSTSRIDVPYNPDLNPTSFTFTAWAFPNNLGTQSIVTSRDQLGGGTQGYILYNIGGTWQFWTGQGGGGGWDTLTGSTAAAGTWTHLAMSYNAATSTKSLYVNGGAPFTQTGAYAQNTRRDLHIGAGNETGTQFYFDGNIDDVFLFDEVLDQTAIQNLMNDSAPDPGLISSDKPYAYDQNLPQYDGGTYYFDDAHVQTLDVYDTGEMTDGAYFPDGDTPTSPAQNELSGWGRPASVATEITIDLKELFPVTGVTIGTHTFSGFANGAPNDVEITFSQDGVTFDSLITETFFAPLNNGHSDFVVSVPSIVAQYVRVSFDGGAIGPGSPNKWMLDEISVFGTTLPEPSAFVLAILGMLGLNFLGWRRRRRADV